MKVAEEFPSSSQFESQFYSTTSSSFEQIRNSSMTNSTSDGIEKELDLPWGEQTLFIFPKGFQVGAHVLYNIVMILGLIGNGCVLLIFSQRKRPFRKLPTPLLANLAVGDLLITMLCLETGYISLLLQYWPFGKFLCHALSPVKPIAVFVSCYTLIALSVDRYLGVKNPLKTGILSKDNVKWTIGIIWVLAACTSLPTGLFTAYETHVSSGLPRCGEYAWGSTTKEMMYDLTLIILQFCAPLLVLVYTYTRISIVVCKNRILRQRMSQGTSPRQKSLRTVTMSLVIIFFYILSWLPYNIVALLAKYNPRLGESDHFPYIFVCCHWLAMSHSVYNPIIYFWLNNSFRATVLELFCRKKAMERRRLDSALFSWRDTVYTSHGRSSISRPPSRVAAALRSPSEPTECPVALLLQIANGVADDMMKPL